MAKLPFWLECESSPTDPNGLVVKLKWWADFALRIWFWLHGCSWRGETGVEGAIVCDYCGREIAVPEHSNEVALLALIEAHEKFFHNAPPR